MRHKAAKRKLAYDDKKYGYTARPGIIIPEKSKQSAVHYISPEDAEYLWGCLQPWIKDVPGPEHAWDPMWFGTLSREGDLKVHNKVKHILNR